MSHNCRRCSRPGPEDAIFCYHCGSELPEQNHAAEEARSSRKPVPAIALPPARSIRRPDHSLAAPVGDLSPVERLKYAWNESTDPLQPVDLRPFAPQPGATERMSSLLELVKADMEIRAFRGLIPRLEEYFTWFPELAESHRFADLLLLEYQLRHRYNDRPALHSYLLRFPDHFKLLVTLVQPAATLTIAGKSLKPLLPPVLDESSQSPDTTTSVEGLYKFIRRIGDGTFGEVWLAEAPGGVHVAIKKIYRPLDKEESKRELNVLDFIKNIRHPYLLSTQAFWQESNRLRIVMELADGSLFDRFKECRKQGLSAIPVDKLVTWMWQAAEGLDYLHSQNVQHRDIKPQNLLILNDYVKVADFGLARQSAGHMVSRASLCGTPEYMAPEVWSDKVSIHSDQYSLAITYAQMRMGVLPYQGFRAKNISLREGERIHSHEEPDLTTLPEPEQAVLRKALAKDPEDRYASCREFVHELQEALVPKTQTTGRRRRRRPVFLPVLAVLAIAGSIGLWWLYVEMTRGDGAKDDKSGETVVKDGAPSDKPVDKPSDKTHVKPPVEPWLPAGFKAAEKTQLSKEPGLERFYDDLMLVRDSQRYHFVLIKGYAKDDVVIAPFYMLIDKVTVSQFRAVSATSVYKELLEKQRLEQEKKGKVQSIDWEKHNGPEHNESPVVYITVTQAHCFAKSLNCQLPTAKQWDRAGGFYDGCLSPSKSVSEKPKEIDKLKIGVGEKIVLNNRQRLKTGDAEDDVSLHRCRDMAGNGYEWTRTLYGTGMDEVPIKIPRGDTSILIRGQGYAQDEPLFFKNCHELEQDSFKLLYYESNSQIGFRIVLEIPPEERKEK